MKYYRTLKIINSDICNCDEKIKHTKGKHNKYKPEYRVQKILFGEYGEIVYETIGIYKTLKEAKKIELELNLLLGIEV